MNSVTVVEQEIRVQVAPGGLITATLATMSTTYRIAPYPITVVLP